MLICSVASASPPLTLTGDEAQRLADMLKGCDSALEASKRYNGTTLELVDRQQTLITKQGAQVDKLESVKLESNPLLWFVAGMLVTGLTVKLVK
jgi:hypothetical protein